MLTLKQLRTANELRNDEWDPEQKITLGFRATEFGGEAGELLNAIKKVMREEIGLVGSRVTREALEEEFGDVLICLDLLAMHMGIDLEEVTRDKFNKSSVANGLKVTL